MTDIPSASSVADLVHRYADAVCRRDEAAWRATWADDAVWTLRADDVCGSAAIVDTWRTAMARYEQVVQTALNGEAVIDASGTRGHGRWYVQEHFRRTDGAVGMLLAWYDDEYVRVDGGWRFSARRLTILYHGAPDLSGSFTRPR